MMLGTMTQSLRLNKNNMRNLWSSHISRGSDLDHWPFHSIQNWVEFANSTIMVSIVVLDHTKLLGLHGKGHMINVSPYMLEPLDPMNNFCLNE